MADGNKCKKCSTDINDEDLSHRCQLCDLIFHGQCLGYSKTLSTSIIKTRNECLWFCPDCRAKTPIENLKKHINEQKQDLESIVSQLAKRVDELETKIINQQNCNKIQEANEATPKESLKLSDRGQHNRRPLFQNMWRSGYRAQYSGGQAHQGITVRRRGSQSGPRFQNGEEAGFLPDFYDEAATGMASPPSFGVPYQDSNMDGSFLGPILQPPEYVFDQSNLPNYDGRSAAQRGFARTSGRAGGRVVYRLPPPNGHASYYFPEHENGSRFSYTPNY